MSILKGRIALTGYVGVKPPSMCPVCDRFSRDEMDPREGIELPTHLQCHDRPDGGCGTINNSIKPPADPFCTCPVRYGGHK